MRAARLAAALVSASRSGVFGVHERRARQMQAHHFHHHLIAVRRAVERARACASDSSALPTRAARRGRPCLRRTTGGCAPSPCSECRRASVRRARRSSADDRTSSAPISRPGTILSHTPRHSVASNMLCDSAIAVDIAITSRLNSDSSMPGWPCVTPSHMAGTPPANCATAPASRAAELDAAPDSAPAADAPTACRCRRKRWRDSASARCFSASLSCASMAAKPCARLVQDSRRASACRLAALRASAPDRRLRVVALRSRIRSVTARTRSCRGALAMLFTVDDRSKHGDWGAILPIAMSRTARSGATFRVDAVCALRMSRS